MKRKGFTLAEIMIVVGVISLLAAVSIPNLLRARLQSNEAAAMAALKTIQAAEITYRAAGNPTYATLTQLGNSTASAPPYIDKNLGCTAGTCLKNGYYFSALPGTYQFVVRAVPNNTNAVRSLCIIEDGVIRTDPAITNSTTHSQCLGYSVIFAQSPVTGGETPPSGGY